MIEVKKEDIFNTYRKWKNIVYYSNILLYKKKIAEFESITNLDDAFSNILLYLSNPVSDESMKYINNLVKKIDFYILPKKVKFNSDEENSLVSSSDDKNGYLEKVNFFIDAPVELFVIDLFLTLNIGFCAYNNGMLVNDLSYANKFKTSVFKSGKINYKERETFEIYFYQYQKWRNNAFNKATKVLNNDKNVVILNFDLKSFYYNACIKIDDLLDFLTDDLKIYFDFFNRVYGRYTKIVSKYYYNIYLHKHNEFMLPIGLESSKILGDLYLLDYDLFKSSNSESKYKIVYYGRYVDDILIVIETDEIFEDKNECLEKINSYLHFFDKDNISLKLCGYSNLELQQKKTDVYFFKNSDKNKYIHVYGAKMKTQASNIGDFFDDDFIDKDYVNLLYKNDRSYIYTKFSDIKSSKVDKLALSRYLTKALNLYKFSDFNESDIEDILNVISYDLSFLNLLDNFSMVEKIFKVLIAVRYDKTIKYYKEQKKFFESELIIKLGPNINGSNKIIDKIKKSIVQSINAAYCLAFCVNPMQARKKVDTILIYRDSMMYDRKLICIPFIQFYPLNRNCNLMDPAIIEDIFTKEFDENKFNYCPYTPSFPEYEMYVAIKSIYQNKELNYGDTYKNYWKLIDKVYSEQPLWNNNQYYKNSNRIKYKIQENIENDRIKRITIYHEPSLNNLDLVIKGTSTQNEQVKEKQKELGDIKELGISLASLPLDINKIISKIKIRKSYRNINYKRQIFKVLNDSKRHNDTHFIVFPELSIPLEWVTDLIFYCKNYRKSIIFGMSYVFQKSSTKYIARNIAGSINYYKDKGTYSHAKVILKEKNYYPYEEKLMLEEYGFICTDAKAPFYYVVNFRGINYSFMLCYELTDIYSRSLLRGYIDNLFVPVLNKDTEYFSNIVNSTSRDLYCYVSMANTSKYGDSRITAPFDTIHKDIVRIKGGDNAFCIIGRVNVEQLNFNIDNQNSLNKERYDNRKKRIYKEIYKPLSAGDKRS